MPVTEDDYKSMTWKEFKEWVDQQLLEQEESQDVEIFYIDISSPYHSPKQSMEVSVNREKGMIIR